MGKSPIMKNMLDNYPLIVGLEATRLCNMKCPHCFNNAGLPLDRELSRQEWFDIIDQIAELKPGYIGWSGGEPLLRPDFLDIFAYAHKKHKILGSLVSNGLTLTVENLSFLKNNGLASLQISIDGSTHAIHSRSRGGTPEMFERILTSMKYCQEAGVAPDLAVLPNPQNISDIPGIIDLAKKYKASSVRFCAFVPFGRGQSEDIKKQYTMSHQQYGQFLEAVGHISDLPVVVDSTVAGPMPPDYTFQCRTSQGCPAGSRTLYISAAGEVFPCTALWDRKFVCGSLRERSLKEIYGDPRTRTAGTFPKASIKGLCRACDNFENCGGACRGTVFSFTGDLAGSLPYCYYRAAKPARPINQA